MKIIDIILDRHEEQGSIDFALDQDFVEEDQDYIIENSLLCTCANLVDIMQNHSDKVLVLTKDRFGEVHRAGSRRYMRKNISRCSRCGGRILMLKTNNNVSTEKDTEIDEAVYKIANISETNTILHNNGDSSNLSASRCNRDSHSNISINGDSHSSALQNNGGIPHSSTLKHDEDSHYSNLSMGDSHSSIIQNNGIPRSSTLKHDEDSHSNMSQPNGHSHGSMTQNNEDSHSRTISNGDSSASALVINRDTLYCTVPDNEDGHTSTVQNGDSHIETISSNTLPPLIIKRPSSIPINIDTSSVQMRSTTSPPDSLKLRTNLVESPISECESPTYPGISFSAAGVFLKQNRIEITSRTSQLAQNTPGRLPRFFNQLLRRRKNALSVNIDHEHHERKRSTPRLNLHKLFNLHSSSNKSNVNSNLSPHDGVSKKSSRNKSIEYEKRRRSMPVYLKRLDSDQSADESFSPMFSSAIISMSGEKDIDKGEAFCGHNRSDTSPGATTEGNNKFQPTLRKKYSSSFINLFMRKKKQMIYL